MHATPHRIQWFLLLGAITAEHQDYNETQDCCPKKANVALEPRLFALTGSAHIIIPYAWH